MRDLEELRRQGLSIVALSELTGYDRKTIRKYLREPEVVPACLGRPAGTSKLDPFKPYLSERLEAGVWNAQVLLRELRERGYIEHRPCEFAIGVIPETEAERHRRGAAS